MLIVGKMNLLVVCVVLLWLSSSSSEASNTGAAVPPERSRSRCTSDLYPSCYLTWHACPNNCPKACAVDCVTCSPVCSCDAPGSVCQDPKFVGGDGVTFYFHGHKDEDFCLISDTNLHINGHFIGKRNPTMNRDFTWVQSIGIVFQNHTLLVAANKTSTWDETTDRMFISFDGNTVSLPAKEGSTWRPHDSSTPVSVSRTARANGVVVEGKDSFRISVAVVPITEEESRVHGYEINGEDCFAHLELGFKLYNLSDGVDGVLGQTYRKGYVSKANIKAAMPVLGGADKYSVSGIFGTDCKASRFRSNI